MVSLRGEDADAGRMFLSPEGFYMGWFDQFSPIGISVFPRAVDLLFQPAALTYISLL